MSATIRSWIVCISVACTSTALASPGPRPPAAPSASVRAAQARAQQLTNAGQYDKALATITEGLAIVPDDLPLLGLKGSVLLKQRAYLKALAAYEAYVAAGATGAKLREAQKIINTLTPVKTTFLEVTVANGPADIYVDSKARGLVCKANPSCSTAELPGRYKVIAERPGFQPWTGSVTLESDNTVKVPITLVEMPSLLTVRVAQPGARITVDDVDYTAPAAVPAGTHRVVVSLAGHAEERREAVAHEGKPVELDIALSPLVPIRVEPPDATLLLDDKPVAVMDGSLVIPPGDHRLVARARGFEERSVKIAAERGPDYQVVVELPHIKPVVPPPTGTSRRKFALVAGGLSVAAIAGGAVLGLASKQADHDAYALCPSPSTPCAGARAADELNQRGRSRALEANVAFGVASGAVIAAAVLWFTGAPESRVAVSAHLGNVAGIDVAARF